MTYHYLAADILWGCGDNHVLQLACLSYYENVVNQTGYNQAQHQEKRYQKMDPWNFGHSNKSGDPIGLGLGAPVFVSKELDGANQHFLWGQTSVSCSYEIRHLILLDAT